MNTMQSENQWFIARDGQQHGPVSDVEIKKLAELGHLRASDLVWRQGFADWRPAVAVFPPQAAPQPAPAPQHTAPAPQPMSQPAMHPTAGRPAGTARPATIDPRRPAQMAPVHPAPHYQPSAQLAPQQQTQPQTQPQHANTREQLQPFEVAEKPPGRGRKILAAIAAVLALAGTGFWFMTKSSGTITASIVTSSSDKPAAAPEKLAPLAPSSTNKPLDVRLQKIPAWQTLKRGFPEWYEERLKEAEGLTGQGKTDAELDKHLVGEIVKLRRQNAKDALAVPADKLKGMATAFLANLQALETVGVPACYAFISRGEVTGVVVEMLQTPDKGPTINTQVVTVFEAVAMGKKNPVKHEAAQKPDYDVLAAELGKLGWSQGDMQLFADPKALGAAAPSRVCSMVQDWFKAHLAVAEPGVQERLLYETLKPVVGG